MEIDDHPDRPRETLQTDCTQLGKFIFIGLLGLKNKFDRSIDVPKIEK